MSQKLCKHYIPRLMALLLAFLLVFSCAPQVRAEGGVCGDGLSWSYNGGMLTISGSGAMYDYGSSAEVPWYSLRDSITSVSLPEGMTSIGGHAFYGCSQLTTLDVPETVRTIGQYAFAACRQMQLLDLGGSLESIGTGAFYSCRSIVSLRLPGTLRSIGSEAFYDCTGIGSLILPENVTSIGSGAFAYCTGLIQVEVRSAMSRLPEWIFFGCSNLTSVSLPSSVTSTGASAFQECDSLRGISRGGQTLDKDSLEQVETPRKPQSSGNAVASASGTEYPDGSIHIQNNTVVENDNSTINSTVDYNKKQDQATVSSNITVTVENDKGWQEAQDAVRDALDTFASNEGGSMEMGTNKVTVYVKDTNTIDKNFMDLLAGRDLTVTFISKDGSAWVINCKDLADGSVCDMRYALTVGSQEICEKLGTDTCYILTFREAGQVNAEVLIRLETTLAMQKATLLQEGKELDYIQTSVVDPDGYAHFYLGSVDKETRYYIAINIPVPAEEAAQEAIVPENVLPAYGNAVNYQPIQYEITGRKSSWNMELGQVMGILAAVMGGVTVLVGIIMFLWNKNRLKNGYVPQWDEEE